MSGDPVRSYYAGQAEREWRRLARPGEGAIEFAVHTAALRRHLQAPLRVLDLGGGPGRIAIWLAEQGHVVTLADLSPELLDVARTRIREVGVERQVEAVLEADARDLGRWDDATFDAVVCLGPFYHLPRMADRDRAAAELVRVLRPGGHAFVAFLSRYAYLRRSLLVSEERRHLLDDAFVRRLLEEGAFHNDVPGRFTHGYGARPEELEPFFAGHGLRQLELLASEGISVGLEAELDALVDTQPDVYGRFVELVVATAADPGLHALGQHLLYVGRKDGA